MLIIIKMFSEKKQKKTKHHNVFNFMRHGIEIVIDIFPKLAFI